MKILKLTLISVFFFQISCSTNELGKSKLNLSSTKIVLSPNNKYYNLKLTFDSKYSTESWKAEYPDWITLNRDNGIYNGIEVPIIVSYYPFLISKNYLEDVIKFTSSSGDTINVKVIYSTHPNSFSEMTISNDSLNFSHTNFSIPIKIYNKGDTFFDWNIINLPNYLTVSKSQDKLYEGDSTIIKIEFNKNILPPNIEKVYDSFFVSNNFLEKKKIIYRINNYNDTKWNLTFKILDADINPNTNEIIAIDNEKNKLYKINPYTKAINSVDIPITPKCVDFNPKNGKIAIGADGKAFIYDFNNLVLENTIITGKIAFDIFYGNNDWIYLTPESGGFGKLVCINPSTWSISNHTGINSIGLGTNGICHPTKPILYLCDTKTGPADIDRLDINNNIAELIGDSRYHGDYAMFGKLTFTENGEFITNQSGTVFKHNSNFADDILYSGTLSTSTPTSWGKIYSSIVHSGTLSKFFAIKIEKNSSFIEYSPKIYRYSDDFYQKDKEYLLNKYSIEINGQTELVSPLGIKVFISNDKSKLITITRSSNTGNQYFGIEIIDI